MAYARIVAEIRADVAKKAKSKAKKEEIAMKYVIQKLLEKWTKGEVQLW